MELRWPGLAAPLLGFASVISFAIALFASGVLAYGAYYSGVVYPGVSVAGQEVGGLDRTSALTAIQDRTGAYLAHGVTFQAGDQTWVVDADRLGIAYSSGESVDAAYAVGRTGNWWLDSRDWLRAFIMGKDVGYAVTFDPSAVETFLQQISAEVTVGPMNPRYQLSSGQIEIVSGTMGQGIDSAATMRGLRAQLLAMELAPVSIVLTDVSPSLDASVLEAMHPRLQSIVEEPLIIDHQGFQWELSPSSIYSLLDISVSSDSLASIAVDRGAVDRMVSMLAADIERGGVSASVERQGDMFVVVPAVPGHKLALEESATKIESAILNGTHHVELATVPTGAAISDEDAARVAERANATLGSTFRFTIDDRTVEVPGWQFAPAVSFAPDEANGTVRMVIDSELLETLLAHTAHEVLERPVNAELRYYNGQVVVVSDERSGRMLDRPTTAQRLADAIQRDETTVAMAMTPLQPEVTAAMAADVQIREMISYGETYYSGSAANRKHNVELATQRANGALVPPGGDYSFVDTIGVITLETGYQVGFGIEGTTDGNVTTVPSVGGGACQVSTTMFQAAFWAGFPIVERNWHLYWMPLYGQPPTGITGLDATIDTTWGLDFQFTNTTDDWIAIVSSANGNAVRFEIWGTTPDWRVEVDSPVVTNRVAADPTPVVEETDRLPAGTRLQVEAAQDGFDVLIVRRVYQGDQLIDQINLHSHYRPASNRTLVGTGT